MTPTTHVANPPAPPPPRPSIPTTTSDAMDLLTHRWVPRLIYLLCQGDARFSDLARALPGLSRRVLTERLRELADEGLIRRTVTGGPPTRITYELTTAGAALRDTLTHLDTWATTYRSTPPVTDTNDDNPLTQTTNPR